MKSGPCTYDIKYLCQIDRFCERALTVWLYCQVHSHSGGERNKKCRVGGGGGGVENEIGHFISLPPPKAIKDIKDGLCLLLSRRQHFEPRPSDAIFNGADNKNNST